MKKDLILDRFGRYFEIPKRLADRGTRIHMVTYSYRRRRREKFPISAGFLINSYGITAFPAFLWQIAKSARSGQFSTVIGSADTPYCLIAVIVGRLFGLRSVCDIYDNFETYDSARLPLMMRALKWVLRNADVNIAFEDSLARHIHQHYQASVSGIVPNGADPDIFYPRDKNRCRTLLGINQDVPVIGYFGSLTAHRGTTVLLDAFARITCHYPDAVFLMAGSGSKHLINSTVNIYHLGIIPQAQVAEAIGASDVATICYADNAFGTFSFPQKMMEYIACQVPFVAPAIGGSQQFLSASPQFLYEIGNDEELANKIIDLLSESMPALPDVVTWDDAAEKFLDCIDQPRLNVTVPPPSLIPIAPSGEGWGEGQKAGGSERLRLNITCTNPGPRVTDMFHPAPKADDSVPLHAPLKPKITVITVCFNAEKTLDRTILSIAQQTYPNIEFIVIDGGSTDATVATIRQHPSTIDHWVSEPDRGISDAMNKGASIASGDYLIFINADDALSGPEAIATAVRRINEKPNHDLYAFCIRFGDEQRSEVRCPRPFGRRMHFKNGLFHQGVLCDARTHRRLHGYSLQYAHALDYDFFLRAYLAGMRVAVFPEVVAFMSAGGLSTRSDFTSISERLRQERSIHLSNAPGPLWRTIYTLYWMLYFPFKHIKHR